MRNLADYLGNGARHIKMHKSPQMDPTGRSNDEFSSGEKPVSSLAQALDAYERRYQFLFEFMADALYITTMDGRLVDTNQAGLDLFGYTRDELMEVHVRDLYADPADREKFIEMARINPILKDYPVHMRRKDGSTFDAMLTNTLWSDKDGNVMGFQGIIRDVTDLREAEATIRDHAAELEARNTELDAFAHTIAHDLKAPLQSIVLAMGLIEDEAEMTDLGQQMMEVAKLAAQKAGKMVDSLMQFAVLRDAQEVIIPVNMNVVTQEAIERIQYAIQERGVSVQIEEPLLPVMGHGPWLEEVLANLVSNAVKYSGRHNPEPRVQIRSVAANGMVRTEVEDNGLGMSEENVEKLFTQFIRFHNGEADGAGMGLSIVARIVDRLGGTIDVKSKVDEGSTFSFTLPAVPANKGGQNAMD